MQYKPTGQKILFRGFNNPLGITSISVTVGVLCWVWIEEAYQITKEADFNVLDESIRGVVPPGLWKQITLIFNPWSDQIWIKPRFFDAPPDPDVFTKTVTYHCNEWLDESDKRMFERMRINNPRRYQVAGMGEWGVIDGLVFENWEVKEFDVDEIRKKKGIKALFGLDFGYTVHPSAFVALFVDEINYIIYVFDGFYEHGLSNKRIAEILHEKGYQKERIRADSAEPKSIDNLRDDFGIRRIVPADKGPDSVRHGIDKMQDFHIVIHPRCPGFIQEISLYQWAEDKFGKKTGKPIDEHNHAIDATRYALEDLGKGRRFGWKKK
ncbi:hypothetical protein MsAc7_17790 [Methanolapillus millepedarum]|uniref:Phage terminase large subunit n=1 Tax=Methanolapillus millepedarum TaxID=3028296 RepID=A0AA96VDD4_9EURY|nr:hypothetical protein MsAc7_17790 [Methanosarcinaceae archaeon Ac7]